MSMDLFSLKGKRALVTGAGRGIGLAISKGFAQAGAEVTLCARSQAEIDAAVRDIQAQGGQAQALVADVTDIAAFQTLVAELPAFDILVNNAGTNRPGPLMEATLQDYDVVMSLNVRAAIFVAQAVARKMMDEGVQGSIINTSSQMGHVGGLNRTLYCASKWAIEGFTKAFAIEMAPHKIRVNTICPTFIETPMTQHLLADKAVMDNVLSRIKLGRVGQPEDIVGGAIYLASRASALVTGSALLIDGGWTAD
ncbi:SDR family NAD(P)-dependent oxidoreductase [Orrella marina]|uniref:3-oxoacyl-ACP reductase n=1 Tax=Orrella marina TaxID=2163011 RepID=A0A2R4XN30_9BURK|nr:SDR family NAD(P)-dependent oxidoreductase [Orrella marina]AWB35203.1 3-oxoacyl-ACP reductase [Orrella marina]